MSAAASGASLPQLRAMIADADPAGLDTVASRWSAVHDALRSAQTDLLRHTLAATDHWSGTAADAFAAHADKLHRALGNGAAYAFNASSGVSCAADALRSAQASMPPEPSPQELLAHCTATNTCGAPSPLVEARRREAAGVIERLQERYGAAAEMFGRLHREPVATDRGVFHYGSSGATELSSSQGAERAATESGPLAPSTGAIVGTQRFGAPDQSERRLVEPLTPGPGLKSPGWAPASSDPHLGPPASTRTLEDAWPAWQSDEGAHIGDHSASPYRTTSFASIPTEINHRNSPLDPATFAATAPYGAIRRIDNLPETALAPIFHSQSDQLASPGGSATGNRSDSPSGAKHEVHGLDSESSSAGMGDARLNGLATAPPTLPVGRSGHRARRRRPEYLVEDEAAWLVEAPANPPVID